MEIKPIKTEQDYQAALAEIEQLIDAEQNTPEGDKLDVLATLVEAYEAKHFPIEAPDPIAAILFRIEQAGLSRKDLEPMLGGSGRVSEVLSGSRGLSIKMIRALHKELGIPAEVLIRESRAA